MLIIFLINRIYCIAYAQFVEGNACCSCIKLSLSFFWGLYSQRLLQLRKKVPIATYD